MVEEEVGEGEEEAVKQHQKQPLQLEAEVEEEEEAEVEVEAGDEEEDAEEAEAEERMNIMPSLILHRKYLYDSDSVSDYDINYENSMSSVESCSVVSDHNNGQQVHKDPAISFFSNNDNSNAIKYGTILQGHPYGTSESKGI